MSLKYKGSWRLQPPPDGQYTNERIPDAAVSEFLELIMKVATQGERQAVLEHFKGYFCAASGETHVWSSSESWAESDLSSAAADAAGNAPLFIEAFFDACTEFANGDEDRYAPDVQTINRLLAKHRVGYVVQPPRLELRELEGNLVEVSSVQQSLAEKAAQTLRTSLLRSEELIAEGRDREAVQESLWLLETVATAFRGLDTGAGSVEGRYFNQIVRELRKSAPGTSLERVLDWATALHGYLSSPTGGGVRHGLDLNAGVPVSRTEARLYCNLIRSYLSFLLASHESLVRQNSGKR